MCYAAPPLCFAEVLIRKGSACVLKVGHAGLAALAPTEAAVLQMTSLLGAPKNTSQAAATADPMVLDGHAQTEDRLERTAGWPGVITLMSYLQPTSMIGSWSFAELESGSHVWIAFFNVTGLSIAKQTSTTSHFRIVETISSVDSLLVSWQMHMA
jgi:hypothetical protein